MGREGGRKGGMYNKRKTRRGVADHKTVCVKGREVIKSEYEDKHREEKLW